MDFVRCMGSSDCEPLTACMAGLGGSASPPLCWGTIFPLLSTRAAGGLSNGVGEIKIEVDKLIINRCQLLIA